MSGPASEGPKTCVQGSTKTPRGGCRGSPRYPDLNNMTPEELMNLTDEFHLLYMRHLHAWSVACCRPRHAFLGAGKVRAIGVRKFSTDSAGVERGGTAGDRHIATTPLREAFSVECSPKRRVRAAEPGKRLRVTKIPIRIICVQLQFNLSHSKEDVARTMSARTENTADQLKPARRLRTMSKT